MRKQPAQRPVQAPAEQLAHKEHLASEHFDPERTDPPLPELICSADAQTLVQALQCGQNAAMK